MQRKKLVQLQLDHMLKGARLIEADGHGPKVYQLADGTFLKIFRRKRLLSSALLRPYSQSFCNNAQRLKELGIPTLEPIAIFDLEQAGLTAVHYKPLPGQSLFQLSKAPNFNWADVMPKLTSFIRNLYAQGIYFRSLHLGNIIKTPAGELGLIDIADMKFYRRALPTQLRRRNLSHFHRYLEREGFSDAFPFAEFSQALLTP
ncbi:toluene tolerance protein [Pseudomonas oligotrophica]|uniref:toluene tolerance protein n=1 Tax=Pseudomonas oligotrophica TaxID=2912055 RepID=UPI001F31D69F|nr:toluene tolerance protein [Pseudomonas oligotrophica]MCF7201105.1 toluene tolerance protein [Pseudomonas oligotrophica]